jgi:hypothetical protein
VGPEKPAHIKTTLSGYFKLPILIDYYLRSNKPPRAITGSALRRVRAALRHRDRVREISFGGWVVDFLGKSISAANFPFPALESLVLRFPDGREPHIPATFLRGPDQSDLPLRRLKLYGGSLPSVSELLLSATALTCSGSQVISILNCTQIVQFRRASSSDCDDLTLNVPFNAANFNPLHNSSQESILLACLQGMQCLCSLDLTTSDHLIGLPPPKDIVPLLKLTHFHYSGPTLFLNNLMSGISAPSLQDARFQLRTRSPFLYFSRVIDESREEFRSISVTFGMGYIRLLSSTQSGKIDFKPSFSFNMNHFPCSLKANNGPPSTKLAMAEELTLNFPNLYCSQMTTWEPIFSLREFLRQFHSVRVLRVSPFPFVRELGPYLQQDGEGIFPLLEEIELSDKEHQRRAAEALAAFEPFASARERAGRLVKVYHH